MWKEFTIIAELVKLLSVSEGLNSVERPLCKCTCQFSLAFQKD